MLEVTDKEIICDYLTIRTEEVFHRQATRISAEESFTDRELMSKDFFTDWEWGDYSEFFL